MTKPKSRKATGPTPYPDHARRAFARPKSISDNTVRMNLTTEMARAKADPAHAKIIEQAIRDGRVRFGG